MNERQNMLESREIVVLELKHLACQCIVQRSYSKAWQKLGNSFATLERMGMNSD